MGAWGGRRRGCRFADRSGHYRAPVVDTSTLGSWVGHYGHDGYILPDFNGRTDIVGSASSSLSGTTDVYSLPSYISQTSVNFHDSGNPSKGSRYTWLDTVTAASPRFQSAVRSPTDNNDRTASCYFSNVALELVVVPTQSHLFKLGLYLLDWDSGGDAPRRSRSVPVRNSTKMRTSPATPTEPGTFTKSPPPPTCRSTSC